VWLAVPIRECRLACLPSNAVRLKVFRATRTLQAIPVAAQLLPPTNVVVSSTLSSSRETATTATTTAVATAAAATKSPGKSTSNAQTGSPVLLLAALGATLLSLFVHMFVH
jgi:hypothetical protein